VCQSNLKKNVLFQNVPNSKRLLKFDYKAGFGEIAINLPKGFKPLRQEGPCKK